MKQLLSVHEVGLDADLNEIAPGGLLPDSARPIDEVVNELRMQGYWGDSGKSPGTEA